MEPKNENPRRKFISQFTTGALAVAGLAMIPQSIHAHEGATNLAINLEGMSSNGEKADAILKKLSKSAHPLAYDMSSVSPWGLIWSNVYYLTNKETGTPENKLGVLNVLRHHGMVYALNDETIKKYKLGEFLGLIDPSTKKPALRNPYYTPDDGTFPLPGLEGIKGLQEKGAKFFVCDMARKAYSQFVGQKEGVDPKIVYQDFVKGTHPGIQAAPSGVWALGRLAENKIAYIDASVG